MKNIGFLAMKNKYPNDYKNITFIFNDIDTLPKEKNIFNYETTKGIVKHFYGYTHALGGIVSINGDDFERVNGFPQYWAWGFEDNLLNRRMIKANIKIDRSVFFPIESDKMFHLKNGFIRDVNSGEFNRYLQELPEGIRSLKSLSYDIDEKTGFVNVSSFFTGYEENLNLKKIFDTSNGPIPFKIGHSMRRKTQMRMYF
jgi:hypothetical protein